jgi:hypothetical protein
VRGRNLSLRDSGLWPDPFVEKLGLPLLGQQGLVSVLAVHVHQPRADRPKRPD